MATIKHNPSTASETSRIPHGTYHISDNPNLYEIQRSNNFEFIVMDIDNIKRAGNYASDEDARYANAQEILRMAVNETFVPHFTQGVIKIRRGNNELKFAGVPSFDSGSLRLVDYIGVDVVGILEAWQNLSYNADTEKVGLVEDYKKTAYLVEYSPDYQVVRRWKLVGCWISSIKEGSFSADSNEKRLIDVQIEYDRALLDTSEDLY